MNLGVGCFRVVAIGDRGKKGVFMSLSKVKGGVFFKAWGLAVKNHQTDAHLFEPRLFLLES